MIMLIIILYFMSSVYSTNELIGSPSVMFDLLQTAAMKRPIYGSQDGSYLTMKSSYVLIFSVIQLCSGLGTVFLDQGYWQRAIASRPTSAVRATSWEGWLGLPSHSDLLRL
jgi:Na+/proline symporter